MIQGRSSSIVKWIFVVSLAELAFWVLLDVGLRLSGSRPEFSFPKGELVYQLISLVSYPVILYFVWRFYKNYRSIQTTDSVKGLMESIIRTRKSVKTYVAINLGLFFLGSAVVYGMMLRYDPNFTKLLNGHSPLFNLAIILVLLFFMLFCGAMIWVFYRLIYGILLKKLFRNYEELNRITNYE